MNKFKYGDSVLYYGQGQDGFNYHSLVAKVVEMYDDGNYIIEASNGCIYKVPGEDLRMYNIQYHRKPVNLSYLIKKVIFSDMATIVIWGNGTKTIVRKQDGDVYDPEKAIAMCFMKKICQKNKCSMNDIFKTWIDKDLMVGTCMRNKK